MPLCKNCQRRIYWVATETRKTMPVDPEIITVISENGSIVRGRVPHWFTCPNIEQHKLGGQKNGSQKRHDCIA